jgi:hypothetical protein
VELEAAPVFGKTESDRGSLDTPFWEGLQVGELRVQRCIRCDKWTWPPQWRCGVCGSWDLDWPAVAPEGRIFSWVRTWQAFRPEMREHVPFVTLVVELPGAGGCRLFGMLVGPEGALRIGAPVVGIIQNLEDGGAVMRWRLNETGAETRR